MYIIYMETNDHRFKFLLAFLVNLFEYHVKAIPPTWSTQAGRQLLVNYWLDLSRFILRPLLSSSHHVFRNRVLISYSSSRVFHLFILLQNTLKHYLFINHSIHHHYMKNKNIAKKIAIPNRSQKELDYGAHSDHFFHSLILFIYLFWNSDVDSGQ